MTRRHASARAGLARSTWERIERGSPATTIAALAAATDAVGLDLVFQTFPGREPRLRDAGQLAIAQWIRGIAHDSWRTTLEQPAGDHGESVDLVLWGATEIIAIEIERLLVDWQAQLRRWITKRDWLDAHHARPVRLAVAVRDTRHNRAAVAPFISTIARSLPAGTRGVMHAVRTGTPLNSDGICWVRQRR
jgi:hypothetical protein